MFRQRKLLLFINRCVYTASAALLIAGLALSISSYQASATNTSVYCANSPGWVFFHPLTPPTITYNAPAGYQITEYCIGDGIVLPTYADNDPPTTSLTLSVPMGEHANASFQIEPIPPGDPGDPTDVPTLEPTDVPTEIPTDDPTEVPTQEPTDVPTDTPTEDPTQDPTVEPTLEPTDLPTEDPTEAPTDVPTDIPTDAPTEDPTNPPIHNTGGGGEDPELPPPARSVVSSAALIPVTGIPVTPGMNALSYGGLGLLGLGLVISGIRKKLEE